MIVVNSRPEQIVVAAASTLLSDTFTDSDGTALSSHTMDVGSGWTYSGSGTWQINSNQAAHVESSTGFVTADAGNANQKVAVDTRWTGTQDTSIVARFLDTNNYWMHVIRVTSADHQLIERTAGVSTVRASAGFVSSANTTYNLSLACSGTSLSAKIDNANEITYTSTSHQTRTRAGIRGQYAGQPTHDNFQVTTP